MRPTNPVSLLAIAIASFAVPSALPAQAGPSPQEMCVAQKLTAQSSYVRCLYKADRRFVRTGDAGTRDTKRATCMEQLAREYQRADRAYGAACPAPGLAADAESFLTACEDTAVAATLLGSFPTCGDGAINVIGELCDGADVGATSCAALGYASGTLACKPDCTFDTSGCTSACTTYTWVTTPSPCSATCGGGARTVAVRCERNPGAVVVDNPLCYGAGPPPATVESCNTQACPTPVPTPEPTPAPTPAYVWDTGPFTPCSTTCGGGGQQTRTVTCRSLETNTTVDDTLCSAISPKPATAQACNSNPCS